MKWLLIVAIYFAPPSAVDWDGSWELGMTQMLDRQFDSELECRNTATQLIADLHKGMLAPVRFRCVSIEASLPEGAPR
jgi:hypothetical protein